jgi:hypothetical protein
MDALAFLCMEFRYKKPSLVGHAAATLRGIKWPLGFLTWNSSTKPSISRYNLPCLFKFVFSHYLSFCIQPAVTDTGKKGRSFFPHIEIPLQKNPFSRQFTMPV